MMATSSLLARRDYTAPGRGCQSSPEGDRGTLADFLAGSIGRGYDSFMSSLALAVTTSLLLLTPTSGPGHGHGHARHDEADLLHSTQLSFAGDGVPVVTVGLMDRQEQVTLVARGGLRITLSGTAGGTIVLPPGEALETRVVEGEPGETRYRVVLEGARGGDLAAIKDARARWKQRGLAVTPVELGGIVGYPGRVLDNRATLLAEPGFHATREAAETRAEVRVGALTLAEQPRVFAEPVRRARGTVVARSARTGLEIRQRDLLTVAAADGGLIEVKRVEHARGYAHHGFQDRSYHGSIVLAVDPTARLAVVNRVDAEHLLRGLVPSETFPTAPAAALDAQAITARGELLAKIGVRHLADPFLVCSSQHCQVYSGTSREKATTDAAVARTRGLMLFDGRGKLVDSVYSASCGGHTEHNEHVWEGVGKDTLRGKSDVAGRTKPAWAPGQVPSEEELRRFILEPPPGTHCGTTSFGKKTFRWVRSFPPQELDRLINARYAIGQIQDIRVLERGVSGRVVRVEFVGTEGTIVIERELAVRRLLGNLRSGMFFVERRAADDAWVFTGGGYGHGVGMCQYGAIGMAERGKDAPKILQHYYSGAAVERVY